MRHFAALAVAVALCLSFACRAAPPKLAELTVGDVARRLDDKLTFVFDCNPRSIWERGHVPHARWVDYAHLTAKDLPSDHEATLIFYCANEY